MSRLKPLKAGDQVICRIKDGIIVSAYAPFDEEITFTIIGVEEAGYLIYVPDYLTIKNTNKITKEIAETFDIENKFIECFATYIASTSIVKIFALLDGMNCKKCKDFCYQAEPNQADNTFVCFVCRNKV